MDKSNKISQTQFLSKIFFLPLISYHFIISILYFLFNSILLMNFISRLCQSSLQQFKVFEKKSNQVMTKIDHSNISEKCQHNSDYESSASESSKGKIYKRKKITKVIHTCCISYKDENGDLKTTYLQKNMSFNFATIQTIRKLALTKSQKHDISLIDQFKKRNIAQEIVKQSQTEVNKTPDQFFPYFTSNFYLNPLLICQQAQF